MKDNFLIAIISLIILTGCHPKKEAEISIVIAHPISNYCFLYQQLATDTIFLENGIGKTTVRINRPTVFYLKHGRKKTQVYILPGGKQFISYNTQNYFNSLSFSGDGANENTYLASFTKFVEEKNLETESLLGLDTSTFYSAIDSLYHIKLGFLVYYHKNIHKLSRNFRKLQKAGYLFNRSKILVDYISYNNLDKPESFFYPKEMKTFESRNLATPSFIEFLDALYRYQADKIVLEDSLQNVNKGVLKAYFKAVENSVSNNEIKETLIFGRICEDLWYYGVKGFDEILDYFEANCTNEVYMQKMERLYGVKSFLEKGRDAPDFNCYDIDSNLVNLKTYRGKYVYIDFWATWCAPCRRELPYFWEIKEKYKNKDIVFISISLDEDKEKWKNMVKETGKKGIFLFGGNGFGSAVAKDYQVHFIPTFVLIDKEGKLFDYQAPAPSDNTLKTLLDSLLI